MPGAAMELVQHWMSEKLDHEDWYWNREAQIECRNLLQTCRRTRAPYFRLKLANSGRKLFSGKLSGARGDQNDAKRASRATRRMRECDSQATVQRFLELLHDECGRTGEGLA